MERAERLVHLVGDSFQHILTRQAEGDNSTISLGGACRFHDHSDIAGWVCKNCTICPYLQGAPVNKPPVEENGIEEDEKKLTEEDAMPVEAVVEETPVEYAMPVDAAVEDVALEDAQVVLREDLDAIVDDDTWKRTL